MIINKAYKTEIAPNKTQLTLLAKSAGTARFAYNWGLGKRIEEYNETGKSSNAIEQHKQLNSIKETEYPWMYEVSKCAPQEALRDLDKAYANFFRRVKQGENPGFPKFKAKHYSKESFRLTGSISVTKDGKRIHLPQIGNVKLKERDYIPIGAKILSATVSKKAGRWFVSVLVEEEINPVNNAEGGITGLDLGIKVLGKDSNNMTFDNPKALNKYLDKLARLQRKLAKQVKGSKNRIKTIEKIRRVYYKITCIRKDAINKMTTAVAKTKPQMVVIEDLAVANMMKNHKLARAISDVCFGEIRRQFEYKSLWYGFELVIADRWFASSKTCSCCGYVKNDLVLSDRIFICPICGLEIDRDLNAAINLRQYGINYKKDISNTTASSAGSNARGDECSKARQKPRERKKRESKYSKAG